MIKVVRLPDAMLITVRCSAATLDEIGERAVVDFPRVANCFNDDGSRQVLWIGPDDWLVIKEGGDEPALLAELEKSFAGHDAAVVETSGNRVRLRIAGPGARDLMARACSLDLDQPHFSPGRCAGTLVARAQAYVLQRDEAPTYDILVRRSLGAYLEHWLLTAAEALPS